MNFLYISFFFPPLAGAEPRHNLSLIRRLHAKGFIPTVITAPKDFSYPKDPALEELIPKGIGIKRITWPYNSNKYINKGKELLKIPPNPLLFKGWKYLYQAAKEAISENSQAQHANSGFNSNSNFSFIYSVHGIGAAHLAAMKLKTKTNLPWVAEFRDPWFHNLIIWKYLKDKSWSWWYWYNLRRTKKLTEKILKKADLVVVESPMHGELLIKDFGVEKNRVVPYGMGYETDFSFQSNQSNQYDQYDQSENCLITFPRKPVIGFVGFIYYGYEDAVKNLTLALRELEKRGYTFSLISVGDTSSQFSKFAREAGLKSFLPIDRVSLPLALSLMREMDFGLVCTFVEHKSHINSKIWEYLEAGLSIVAIVPKDGAMAKIIEAGACGYILPYDADGMIPILEKIFGDYKAGKTPKATSEFISQFSCEHMVDKLAKKLREIIK